MGNLKNCIIIPDSYKGTLSAIEICTIMKKCILSHFPNCRAITIPIADGGEGTVDCFLHALNYKKISVLTSGPYNEPLYTYYAKYNNTAIIEMASVAGLPLVPNQLNPCKTTTYGLGALILDAVQRGCKNIVIGLGGSCTNDAGIGMALALGAKFYNQSNQLFTPSAIEMTQISHVDISPISGLLKDCRITAMCDITNPMHGPNGAAYIYAPQKGADKQMVKLLDENLVALSQVFLDSLNISVSALPGSGSAGALGAGIVAFLNGSLKSGIETILDLVAFDDLLADTDMVFTGEGKIDSQSLYGKAVIGIAEHAKKHHVPVTVVAGSVDDGAEKAYDMGITSLFSINRKAVDFQISRDSSDKNLAQTMDAILRLIKAVP